MPITFDCPECGKSCRAPAEMAGRKAKCQDCKAIITVPAEEEKVAEKPLPKRKAVPAAADDADEEKPRAKKSRKDDDDEDKPRAKKSRKDDDDDDEDDKPRKKKTRQDDEDDDDSPRAKKSRKDDDDEEDDSPAVKKKRKYHDEDDSPRKKTKPKKKSGSGMGMILMLGGGALVLVLACGGFGFLAWSMGWIGGASEMAFAPDGCTHIQVTHVSQIESSAAYQTMTRDNPLLKQQFAAPGANDALTQAGVDSTFTAGAESGDIIVIKTKKSISAADLSKGKNYKETKAGKYTMLEGPGEAMCVADSSTVVYSHQPDLLKKVLERGKAPELSPNMKKALGYTDLSKSVAFANDHKGGVKRAAGGFGGMGGLATSSNDVECSGGYQQIDSDIRVTNTYLFKDAASAAAAKKQQDDGLELLKKMAGGKADNPLLEIATAMQLTVSGSELKMEGTYKADTITRLLKGFGGGGGGVPGGPGGPGGKPR